MSFSTERTPFGKEIVPFESDLHGGLGSVSHFSVVGQAL